MEAETWGWADCIQVLIERGHSFGEIKKYTLQQLRMFTEAAMRARRRQMAEDFANLCASRYDKNGKAEYLRALKDG